MFKILLVEDDRMLARLLEAQLRKYEYDVRTIADFGSVRSEFESFAPHLVLMDINLPKYDGYYWCRQIRAVSTCPILFISARDSKMDQVMALEHGADDYVTKPFDYDIVIAKINSQLRRAYGSYANPSQQRTAAVDGLTIDLERLTLAMDDRSVDVSHTEAKLLDLLIGKAGSVVSRDRLLEKIWDDQTFVDDNTLNVYITRVRKKLMALNINDAIQTVRGQGYRLMPNWREPV